MKNITNGTSLTLFGLIIAAIGVISPIAWDWWNKRTQISIETKSNVSIVSIAQPIKNLEMLYNGKKVSELHKIAIIVRNSGKTPVTKEDVVSPLTLNFSADEILEAVLTRKEPKDLNLSMTHSGNTLQLNSDLINPNEEVEIEVLIAGKYDGFSSTARIKNISNIEITDSSTEKKSWTNIGIGAYISGFFGLLFMMAGVSLLIDISKKKIASSLLKQGASKIFSATTAEQALDFQANEFSFLTSNRRKTIQQTISELTFPLNDNSKFLLSKALTDAVNNESPGGGAIVAFFVSGVAFWYVISKLI